MLLLHGFADTPQTWERVLPLLPGASAPPLPRAANAEAMLDVLEARLPDGLVDVVGNSLGGWLALKLAERGRARSVVAFAPAGGWADDAYEDVLARQRLIPNAWTELLDAALRDGWPVEPERIACPVRIVWGTADPLLPWPSAAHRYRHDWLPHADWVVLDGVGHYPQLERPLESAQLILGFTT